MKLSAAVLKKEWVKGKEIGRGSDGCIVVWRHKKSADIHIVSKQPVDWKARRYLEAELEITKAIGNHPNILQTFGSDEYWLPHGPAIFYEYCELGSAWDYQTELFTTYGEVPEETVWKLMADMSKALHWLQNALDKPYIHNDLKPENILAAKSRSHVWTLNAVPILPDFKICDFARVVDFAGKHGPDCVFNGTPEYAAPISERRPRITPQADIWSLGATLQAFAYGFKPTMTTKTFIATRAKAHQSVPAKHSDFELNKWRDLVPVIYRPLNATAAEQRERWDIPRDERGADLSMEPPMSSALNDWYSMCMQLDQRSRATAADLARWFVPVAERQVRVLYARRRAAHAKQRVEELEVRALKAEACLTRKGKEVVPLTELLPALTFERVKGGGAALEKRGRRRAARYRCVERTYLDGRVTINNW